MTSVINAAPTSAAAVANAFLDIQESDHTQFPPIDQMKLQKLVYYAHACGLRTTIKHFLMMMFVLGRGVRLLEACMATLKNLVAIQFGDIVRWSWSMMEMGHSTITTKSPPLHPQR